MTHTCSRHPDYAPMDLETSLVESDAAEFAAYKFWCATGREAWPTEVQVGNATYTVSVNKGGYSCTVRIKEDEGAARWFFAIDTSEKLYHEAKRVLMHVSFMTPYEVHAAAQGAFDRHCGVESQIHSDHYVKGWLRMDELLEQEKKR